MEIGHQDVFELFKFHEMRSLCTLEIERSEFLNKLVPFFITCFLVDVQEMLLKILLANLEVHFTEVAA